MLRTDALVARGVVKGRSTPINDQRDLPNFQITKRSVRVLLLARKVNRERRYCSTTPCESEPIEQCTNRP